MHLPYIVNNGVKGSKLTILLVFNAPRNLALTRCSTAQ